MFNTSHFGLMIRELYLIAASLYLNLYHDLIDRNALNNALADIFKRTSQNLIETRNERIKTNDFDITFQNFANKIIILSCTYLDNGRHFYRHHRSPFWVSVFDWPCVCQNNDQDRYLTRCTKLSRPVPIWQYIRSLQPSR